jgi:hypothetical protein
MPGEPMKWPTKVWAGLEQGVGRAQLHHRPRDITTTPVGKGQASPGRVT